MASAEMRERRRSHDRLCSESSCQELTSAAKNRHRTLCPPTSNCMKGITNISYEEKKS
jgi:hypothetical protein